MTFRLVLPVALVGSGTLACVLLNGAAPEAMREAPIDAFSHFSRSRGPVISSHDILTLKSVGIVVIDNVLNAAELLEAREDFDKLILGRQFLPNDNNDALVRRDTVHWIAESIGSEQSSVVGAGLLLALRTARSVPHELTQNGDFSSASMGVPFANQIACYDGENAHYVPHRDTPEIDSKLFNNPLRPFLQPGLDERELTIIIYLNNKDWDQSQGGNLKCYMNAEMSDVTGKTATEIINIAPIGGRMVIFDSKRILHEVCPTNQRRRALTCWVGGSHSRNEWMRVLCIPPAEIQWNEVFKQLISYWRS
jgi:hypothetical protein